jgi:transcription antitermination factor NusG
VREGVRVRVTAGEFNGAAGVIERVDHRRERALVRVADRDVNQDSAVILGWDEFELG